MGEGSAKLCLKDDELHEWRAAVDSPEGRVGRVDDGSRLGIEEGSATKPSAGLRMSSITVDARVSLVLIGVADPVGSPVDDGKY